MRMLKPLQSLFLIVCLLSAQGTYAANGILNIWSSHSQESQSFSKQMHSGMQLQSNLNADHNMMPCHTPVQTSSAVSDSVPKHNSHGCCGADCQCSDAQCHFNLHNFAAFNSTLNIYSAVSQSAQNPISVSWLSQTLPVDIRPPISA